MVMNERTVAQQAASIMGKAKYGSAQAKPGRQTIEVEKEDWDTLVWLVAKLCGHHDQAMHAGRL
jgi:hypothetical protein